MKLFNYIKMLKFGKKVGKEVGMLKRVHMFKPSKVRLMNSSLLAQLRISYQKSIKSFGLRLKTERLKKIKLNALPVYDDRCIYKNENETKWL